MNIHSSLALLIDVFTNNFVVGTISSIAIALIFYKQWKDIKYLDHGVKHKRIEAMLSLTAKGLDKVHPIELEITAREFLGVQISRELILRLSSADEPLRNLSDYKDSIGNVKLSSDEVKFESTHFLPLAVRKNSSLFLLPILIILSVLVGFGNIVAFSNAQIDGSVALLTVLCLVATLILIWNLLDTLRSAYAEERLLRKEFPLIGKFGN